MELIPVTIMRPIGTRNGPIWGESHEEPRRKFTKRHERPARKNRGAGDTLLGHGSAHFYTGVPPVSALCEAACQSASECGRQAGGEDAFGVHNRHLSLPPRAAALAPLRGYPKLMVAVLHAGAGDTANCPSGQLPHQWNDEARTTKKEQRRRKPTMKKTRDELQNELAEAQLQYMETQTVYYSDAQSILKTLSFY